MTEISHALKVKFKLGGGGLHSWGLAVQNAKVRKAAVLVLLHQITHDVFFTRQRYVILFVVFRIRDDRAFIVTLKIAFLEYQKNLRTSF